jgi:hypothetical protein
VFSFLRKMKKWGGGNGNDKISLTLDFSASALSVNNDGDVASFTDAGFGDGDSTLSFSYESELFGAVASFKFGEENLRFLDDEIGEMFSLSPLSLDELYGWIKPFGEHFKFIGGIFENTDGIADYTDDIDDYSMGVFIFGEDGEPFSEPEAITNTSLTNGFLTDAVFGPVTLQLLLASNYSGASASVLASGLLTQMLGSPVEIGTDQRFFRVGGRVIIDAGIGTFSGLFKTFRWPVKIVNPVEQASYPGTRIDWTTFGVYFDLTTVENLGVTLGYTGFLPINDAPDIDNVLYSGIDIRATWTGIQGLSLSSHNNISFAKGPEKDWMGMLGEDSSLLTLYNAVGATKELTDQFSIGVEIGNVYSKLGKSDDDVDYDNFWGQLKFIVSPAENAEFSVGLRFEGSKRDEEDLVTVFSVPVGITVSF